MAKKRMNIGRYDRRMAPAKDAEPALAWRSPKRAPFRLAGFAWFETERLYRRMPRRPKDALPEAVDNLANHTSGGQVAFRTDSRRVAVRVKLAGAAYMDHMTAVGMCGFDCYVGPPGKQRYANTIRYDFRKRAYEYVLLKFERRKMRDITLNFPLYIGVKEVLVGLERGARVTPPARWASDKRVVVYGTSITQGGCASRPGMSWTNIVSRRENVEVVNLGFSGSGKGEAEVARTVAGLGRAGLFVLDYEANCVSTELFAETLPRFLDILRARHPATPILVVSRVRFAGDLLDTPWRRWGVERKAIQKKEVAARRRAGDRNIHFLDGSPFLGNDFDECAVDGVHQTDLGFLRIADAMAPAIRRLMKR